MRNSMRYFICLGLLLSCGFLAASWDWAYTIGGSDMERSWDIACDSQSNIFVAGEFSGTMMVNGEAYPALGLNDSYVAKYSATGQLLWVQAFGSANEDCVLGVDTDAAGNCYVGGYFIDTFTCQGQSRISNGMWDAYVLKLNPEGDLQWLRSFGGPLNDIGHGLAVNASGQVYLAGWFADSIKFSPTDTITSAGGSDIYISAWDAGGNFRWAKSAGTPGVEYGYKVACDNAGNAYVTGSAGAGSIFGPLVLESSGMYVAKYSSIGMEQWLAPSNGAMVISVSVQPENSISQKGMVCGRVVGSGSIGNFPFQSLEEGDDFYWAQFDAESGVWSYAGFYGGNASDKGRDCDYEAFPVFVGTYDAQASFWGQNFISNGESDLIMGWGSANMPQLHTTGGLYSEIPYAVKILPNGKLAVSGWHFGLGIIGTHTIDSGDISNMNAFVACFDPSNAATDEGVTPAPMSCSPNPFLSAVKISGLKDHDNIRVYNLKGQIIRKLELDRSGSCAWDGLDFRGNKCSSGIYLLKAGTAIKKVMKL